MVQVRQSLAGNGAAATAAIARTGGGGWKRADIGNLVIAVSQLNQPSHYQG